MKKISEIQGQIQGLHEKIQIVDKKISEIEQEIQSLTQTNVGLVEANLLKKRKSVSLTMQRDQIFKLNQQLNELKTLRESLQQRLSQGKKKLRFSEIYTKVETYKETEGIFFGKVDELKGLLVDLDHRIKGVKEKVGDLKTFGHPLYQLRKILKQLRADNVGLRAFIEEKSVKDHSQDDDLYLSIIGNKYRNL
jgi:chromosome segregation ATPase